MSQGPGQIATYATNPGGTASKLNVTAATVIKASPGKLRKIVVLATGSGGNLVVNDLASTSGDAAANEILKVPNTSLAVGQVIDLNWPCATGIAITAVTSGGGVFSVSYD